MRRARNLLVISVIGLSLAGWWPHRARAEPETVSPDRLEEAATSLLSWFKKLLAHLDELVEAEHKRRLIERLRTLEEGMYALERGKRDLVDKLKRGEVDPEDLDAISSRLTEKTEQTRESLHAAGLAMREQFRFGGVEAEQELRDAVGTRKNWLLDLRADLPLSGSQAESYAERGERVAEVLLQANQALIVVIYRLEQPDSGE